MADFSKSREWTAAPEEQHEIPQEYLAAMRFRYALSTDGREVLRGRCRAYRFLAPGWVELEAVLVDTSERHNGVVLKKRVTFHPTLVIGAIGGIIVPLEADAD